MIEVKEADIVAFGPHPDDVEMGCGGLAAKEAALGHRVGIVDMTLGEMGTNGTVEERLAEAKEGARILGASWRINLEIPDRKIEINDENVTKVVEVLRKARPKYILVPYWEDRHPDHVNTHKLVMEAWFSAGLRKFLPELEAYRPKGVLFYFLNKSKEPSLIVDISKYFETKKRAIYAHESQFGRPNPALKALFGNRQLDNFLESKDMVLGGQIGAQYGEGFLAQNPLKIIDPMTLWREG